MLRSPDRLKLALFIPTFNVGNAIYAVLGGISSVDLEAIQRVLVIDNGSTDNTLSEIRRFLSSSPFRDKFRVMQNRQNYSLGGSTIIAFREAIREEHDFLLCMHGDGQAAGQDISKFLQNLDRKIDFIVGSRFQKESSVEHYSRLRLWGNRVFALLQKNVLGAEAGDLGAFIAFNLRTIQKLPYARIPSGMSYHPTLILFACWRFPVKFREVPIFWGAVEASSVNIFTYGLRHLRTIFAIRLGKLPLSTVHPEDFQTNEVSFS